MSDNFNDNQTQNTNPQPPVAFCQNCGKPLHADTARVVGPAVYCEPCLEARIAGNPIPPPPPAGQPDTAWQWGAGTPSGWTPGPTGAPNPGLAALLGLIPGVGAMYNEQYAKGLVHLVIFAVLIMFSHVSGIFVLFVFGWEAYMSIEAHHTAKARRDGTPLPNPFGFNDIGERMGFGKAWPNAPDVASVARDAAQAAAAGFQSGFNRNPSTQTPPPPSQPVTDPNAAPWGAPSEAPTYAQTTYGQTTYGQAAYGQAPYGQPYPPPYSAPYTQAPSYGAAFIPPIPVAPMPPLPQGRFPVGAAVLIGLGVLFLLGTTGIFRYFPGEAIVALVLLGLGVWIFVRRMTETGASLADDGAPGYQFRVVQALRGSIWLVWLGVLWLLDSFHLIYWRHSWPSIIILIGIMSLVQRAALNAALPYPYMPGAPSQTAPSSEMGAQRPSSTPPETHLARANFTDEHVIDPNSSNDLNTNDKAGY